jgi:hypothetical protein
MYNLLLLPESDVSDIDIDFDEGRSSVMDYVIRNIARNKWHKLSPMVKWQPNRQFTARAGFTV